MSSLAMVVDIVVVGDGGYVSSAKADCENKKVAVSRCDILGLCEKMPNQRFMHKLFIRKKHIQCVKAFLRG